MAGSIGRSTLPNGLRIVTEEVPDLASVTLGAWVGVGSRNEDPDAGEWGASHFLEHLLFKGSDERSARQIAEAVESVGGEMNAFTAHEQTAYYLRIPAKHFQMGMEILGDVLFAPAFRAGEVESERQVILEEIGMRDDTPEDLVHDLLGRALFPDHPLGREVIGSRDSISSMERDAIVSYHARHYRAPNVVLAVAGGVGHEEALATCADFEAASGAPQGKGSGPIPDAAPRVVLERDTEQAHMLVGLRALPALDEDRYALAVLNQALGGGMASRLFQEVREERGLAYSVYSYRAAFQDAGMLAIYAGTSPEHAPETLDIIDTELDRLVKDGSLPDDELCAARGHIAGSLAMSLETSASRMRRIGRAELVEGEVPSLTQVIDRFDAVDADSVARVVERVLVDKPRTLAIVGPKSVSKLGQ